MKLSICMRKTKIAGLLLICTITFMNVSCKKSATDLDNSASAEYLIKLNTLRNETNQSSKKVIYTMFSSSDKLKFWQGHFLIASKQAPFRKKEEKLFLISELASSIKREIFEGDTNAKDIFLNYTIPLWLERAEKVFSKEELTDLLLFNYQDLHQESNSIALITPKASYIADEPPVDCFCHVGNVGYACKQLQIGFPSGITVVYGNCEEAERACSRSTRGCGLLWLESCNGSHCNY